MINKFNDFRRSLILEAKLSIHDDLMNRLGIIKKGGGRSAEIAGKIVDYISDEEWISSDDLKQDFFNITDANDKVSFIQSNRITSEPYMASSRSELKVGRALRYFCDLYEISVTDKDIEDLVNKYKSVSENDGNDADFRFLVGEEIKDGYDSDNYASGMGTLGDSCMNDEFSYLKIYRRNPEKIRLLVLYKDEEIIGRALVWKLDKSPCDAKFFMDRVYSNYQHDVNTFIDYATKNGWMYKKRMSYGCDEAVQFIYKNKDVFGEIRVKLDGNLRKYPFIDTLQFLSRDRDELSNIGSWKCIKLDDTDGEDDKCNWCKGKAKNDDICEACGSGARILKQKGIEFDLERNRKKNKK